MGAQQLDLRDIHLPEAINWWPPAIGWWLLAILIPLSCFFLFWLYKRITRKTALKTAKKLLLSIKQNNALDDKQKLVELSALLRRVVVSISPRSVAASLTGQEWLIYLDSSVKDNPFTTGAGQVLADAHYRNNFDREQNISELIAICENWLASQKLDRNLKNYLAAN